MTYKVPQEVRRAARLGLKLRKMQAPGSRSGLTTTQAGKLGIGSGVARARDLAAGSVSLNTLERMVAYFRRHRGNYKLDRGKKPEEDRGYVSGLLWGGEAGKNWAEKTLETKKKARSNMAKKAPTRRRRLPIRNGRAIRNGYGRAKPNGNILGLYISNDPGAQEYLQDLSREMVQEWADSGFDFEELADAVRDTGENWEMFEDYVWDWATQYAEFLTPEQAAGEIFTNSDLEDAARYMGNQLSEGVSFLLPISPEYLYETLHPDMPAGYMGTELDIPERPLWWMDNNAAQREAVTEWLNRIEENPPRRARKNFPRESHSALQSLHSQAADYYDGAARALARKGYEGTDAHGRAKAQRMRNIYISNAHERSTFNENFDQELRAAKESLGTAQDMFNEANRAQELKENPPRMDRSIYGRSSRTLQRPGRFAQSNPHGFPHAMALQQNPPKKKNKWIRHDSGLSAGEYLIFNGADWAVAVPYKPRKSEYARQYAEIYEGEKGQKVPKGTKYLLVDHANGAVTAHKTLASAKKKGIAAVGLENKAKKNKPTGSLLPLASDKKKWSGGAAKKRIQRFCKLKDGTLSEATMSKAFAHVPPKADRQKISAYKLPIADVVGGRLVAVPRGVKAASASLDGSRGGVKLSTNAKSQARRKVNLYMAKIERANKGKK